MLERTHYETLGLTPRATPDEIRLAYRTIALQTHPDKAGSQNTQAIERFQAASAAYRVLIDPALRRAYDQDAVSVTSVQEFFLHSVVGRSKLAAFLPTAPKTPCRGLDLCVVVPFARRDAVRGGVLTVRLSKEAVHQEIPLPIPSDADGFDFCVVPKIGAPGKNGGENGDVLIVFVDESG